jgi:hypothetical protein
VTAIENRVSTEMYAYLEPSQRLAGLIDAAVDGRPVLQGMAEAEALARRGLVTIPSATGMSYADPAGNFFHVREEDDGMIEDKLIERGEPAPRVTLTKRAPDGTTLSTRNVANDPYDARQRPWYIEAVKAMKPVWTDTYQNLTLHRPAISYSVPRFDKDGKLLTVVGIDIEVDDLCIFLSKLRIGTTGKAYIIDRTGRIVAFPSANWKPANTEGMKPPRMDQIGDDVLERAYLRMEVEGYGRKVIEIGDKRVIVSAEPVKMLTGRDWLVLIVVPESDFVGFVTNSSLVALVMLLAIVAIVVALAGLLGWRNVVAGRRVAMATQRQQALEAHSRALVEIGRKLADKSALQADLRTATETAAETFGAKYAAIWRLSEDRQALACADRYERDAKYHATRATLRRDNVPVLFSALEEGAVIDTVGDPGDPRAVELAATYLAPMGVKSIYVAPIMLAGQAVGMLTVVDPEAGERAAGLAAFCDALAILLALKFAGAPSAAAASP